MSTPRGDEHTASGGGGARLVAAGILASRIAGLARELAVAAFLGNGAAVDAFTAAFRIPNTLQNLLGEGVLSASFIPSYARLLEEGREREAAKVASTILTLLVLLTGGLVIIGVVFAGPIASVVAGGFTGERRELTITLIRIVTPGIGLLVLSAWCLGVLNSHGKFFLSYVAPVGWNLVQIVVLAFAGTLLFTDAAGSAGEVLTADGRELALALGIATLIGAAVQLAIQFPEVRRLRPDLLISVQIDDETRTVLRGFVPVVGARGVVQLSAFLDIFLGSFLVVGAVAALRYGTVLYLLPISVFGMSIAAAELPELSRSAAGLSAGQVAERARAMVPRLQGGLARMGYLVVPTAVCYIVAGDVVVGALLQRGEFDRLATLQVWAVIAAYGFGLVAATSARLLQSACYGIGDTTTPARASVARVAVSTLLGVVLMFQLDRIGLGPDGLQVIGDLPAFGPVGAEERAAGTLPRLGPMGLALGAAAAAWVEAELLRRRLVPLVGRLVLGGRTIRIVSQAAAAAVAVTLVGRFVFGGLPPLLQLPLVLGPAGIAYLLLTKQLGFPFARAMAGRPPGRGTADGRLPERARSPRSGPN